MWAVTGSSMARFWTELGRMPPNGVAALLHGYAISLPSRHGNIAKIYVLRKLLHSGLALDPVQKRELLHWAENAAMLTYALQEFSIAAGPESNMETFLDELMTFKIMHEASNPE